MVDKKPKEPKRNTNARTQKRERELMAVLSEAGWDKISTFLTAIKNGIVEAPKNPNRSENVDDFYLYPRHRKV